MTYPGTPDQQQPPIIPPNQPYPAFSPYATPPKKKHTVRNVLLIVVDGLVALCGVGTIVAAATKRDPAPAAAASPTPAGLPIFNSPTQVIDYLNTHGAGCGTESPVNNPTNGSISMSDCGGSVVVSRFLNPGSAQDAMTKLSDLLGPTVGYAIVTGDWMLNLGHDQTYAQKVADLLHASLTKVGGKAAPPPPPSTAPAVPSIEDGTWTVGVDMPAGTYRTTTNVSADCYWKISKTGSNGDDIIKNDFPGGGRPQVTLKVGQDFQSERCGTWHKVG